MRTEIILTTIIFGLLDQNVFSDVVSGSESGDATTDNIKRDLCYMWRTKHYPFWADPLYKNLLKKETAKFFFKNGTLLVSPAEIDEKCKIFPKYILDPEHIQVHYEICYYAKHGFWYAISANEHEAKERLKLLNKYVIVVGKRINQRDVKLLCSNYREMYCPLCKKEKEQMCYYAEFGIWKNNQQPDRNCQNRFFYTGENLIDWQEIWNKCTNYFKGKPFSIESIHYPPCSYSTILTPSPNTPPLPSHPPLKTTTTPQETSPQNTIPDSSLPSNTTSPNTPSKDYSTRFTLPISNPPSTDKPLSTTLPPDISIPNPSPSGENFTKKTPSPEITREITKPYAGYITDEKSPLESSPEDSLPLWYYPNDSVTTHTLPTTFPSTLSTTTMTNTTNFPPTSTKLTWSSKWRTFTNHANLTIPTIDTTPTKPNTTIISTPTTITTATDLTTVEEPVCSTCSHKKETSQCNEKHLHLHLHIDGNDSILTKEVLKTLKILNGEKD